jgi:fibronectin type 3 domain-containing protein
VTVIRPPVAVDSLTVYPDSLASDAVLRWAPSAGANSYKVYRGTEYEFVLDETTYIGQTATTTYTDVGVLATAGEKYYVVVASTDIIARGR